MEGLVKGYINSLIANSKSTLFIVASFVSLWGFSVTRFDYNRA